MDWKIPQDVGTVLEKLMADGCDAWCVGGCVRDLLLGRIPGDWDVATSARPEQTQALFAPRTVLTGIRHGTVSVLTGLRPVEVTTYRCDGAYGDHRHPDGVIFTSSLEEDLKRRDFTVNAMALHADGIFYDPFGGRADLERRILRCVGNPAERFNEDALRILRCLRFESVLCFQTEPETERALRESRELLTNIAGERIREELLKLLCGPGAGRVLLRYPEVLGVFLPELLPSVGFDQRNRHHCFDVWEHTAHSVDAAPPDPVVRMTMLLHDLGKPASFTLDDSGSGHFYGHPAIGKKMAEAVLSRLRFDRAEKETILTLVEYHDRSFPRTPAGARRVLRTLGESNARLLLTVKRADNLAQAPEYRCVMQQELDRFEALLNCALEERACVSLRQLAVNGRDLTALGLYGPAVGQTLERLLDSVVEGSLPNDRETLLDAVKRRQQTAP